MNGMNAHQPNAYGVTDVLARYNVVSTQATSFPGCTSPVTADPKCAVSSAGLDDIKAMPYCRAVLAESLRLYPQPPLLIRRALGPDTLPPGLNGDPNGYPIGAGADLFISVWNLHHSPHLWKDPETFRPERFSEVYENPAFDGKWAGEDGVHGFVGLLSSGFDVEFGTQVA